MREDYKPIVARRAVGMKKIETSDAIRSNERACVNCDLHDQMSAELASLCGFTFLLAAINQLTAQTPW